MKARHYILYDTSVQWFAALATLQGSDDIVVDFRDIPPPLWNCPFMDNLTAREPAFENRHIRDDTWRGWSISETEYRQVSRLLDLRPAVDEFNRLAGSAPL